MAAMGGGMIIEVEILEARDLLASDSNGFSDPYVVIDKTPGLASGAKTPVVKKSLNPVWNYSTVLHFDHNLSKIKFRVFDWDRFSSDDPLGTCSFSPSIFNDGVPLEVWEPLVQRPKKKKPGQKGPWPTKGELHLKLSAKNACQFCNPGGWFALQGVPGGAGMAPQMVPLTMAAGGPPVPFGDVCLGLGWDISYGVSMDLDASVIAFNAQMAQVDLVYYGKLIGCGGAVRHSGDNRTGAGEGDDEVITLSLPNVPPNITRLVCVVNSYSNVSLSHAKSAYVRIFNGRNTLGAQKLTKVCDSLGLFFCFFQRNSQGAWFFQTVLQPVPGHIASESLPAIRQFLASVPYF